MNIACVKEEEQNAQTPVSIPKTILTPMHNNENAIYLKTYMNTINKFIKALQKYQVYQAKNQGNSTPVYPFVLQYSYNELIVHLGSHQVSLSNRKELTQFLHQLQIQYYVPKVSNPSTPPTPPIRLTIQKRRGIASQDQKDTKNIPKNYAKAIITFASKNQNLCFHILKDQLKVVKFLERITVYKKSLMNIRIFSSLLTQSEDPEEEEFNKTFRILSRIFVQRYAINYIFNSKIVQHNWHLKYRQQIYKGIKSPKTFSHIKNL